jgi:hypothetical protein
MVCYNKTEYVGSLPELKTFANATYQIKDRQNSDDFKVTLSLLLLFVFNFVSVFAFVLVLFFLYLCVSFCVRLCVCVSLLFFSVQRYCSFRIQVPFFKSSFEVLLTNITAIFRLC